MFNIGFQLLFNHSIWGGGGGCCPRPQPKPCASGNILDDAVIGMGSSRRGCGAWLQRGTVIDFDGDGKYTKGKDGVLAFDFNGDGEYSDKEISKSRDVYKAVQGNYDFDGDGCVSKKERLQGRCYSRIDRDGDGELNSRELKAARGGVWVDRDKDGKRDCGEVRQNYNLDTCSERGHRVRRGGRRPGLPMFLKMMLGGGLLGLLFGR